MQGRVLEPDVPCLTPNFDKLASMGVRFRMKNLALDPKYRDQLRRLMAQMWRVVGETGDHSLYNSHYPALRLAPFGPKTGGET